MNRVTVYDTALFGEPGSKHTTFDYDRIRGRWSDRDPVTGVGSRGAGRGEAVILTGNGRSKWVLEKWTDWSGEAGRFERLDEEDARQWLERNEFERAVAEHFTGPGLDDALHDLRMLREINARRDEIIRAAKAAGADVTTISREGGISRPTVYEALKETSG